MRKNLFPQGFVAAVMLLSAGAIGTSPTLATTGLRQDVPRVAESADLDHVAQPVLLAARH